MTALPDPERGGTLDELRELLNVPDDQWTVLLASVVCNFLPTGTIPILALTGPEGSGKSSVAIRLRQLIDPCTAPTRAGFVDERDLLACVRNNAVIVLDNVSRLSRIEADMLCRLASGAGIECRELYTSSKVALIGERRPIVITSITDVASGYADLRDRCFAVALPPINQRMSEADLEKRFKELHPRLVGAIADRVAAALRELANVKLDTDHRLLDAIHWAVAAEQGMGEGQLLLGAIENAKRDTLLATVEASPLGQALLRYIIPDPKGWEGTAQELLAELHQRIDADNGLNETQRKNWLRQLPGTPKALSNELARLEQTLRRLGVSISRHRGPKPKKERLITIVSTKPDGDGPKPDGEQLITIDTQLVASITLPPSEPEHSQDTVEPEF